MKIFNLLIVCLFALCACDTGLKQMGPTEYGVIFRKLPPAIGGGVSSSVKLPGQLVVIYPWDSLYKFDTAVQDVTWGVSPGVSDVGGEVEALKKAQSMNSLAPSSPGYLNTRASDGNEVALAVTVRYKVTTDPDRLVHMIENVLTSDEEVHEMVVSVARADIRTYMNQLKTAEFLDKDARYKAVDAAKRAMQERLNPYGIEIQGVNLNDFRFERVMPDGSVDTSYQDRLKEIQKLREDTEREKQRIETVIAKKGQELNEAQAIVNRQVAEAEGTLNQSKFRGDSYYQSKQNEAKGILALGQAEVKGLIEKVNALNGAGGHEILKLELAKQLLKNDPQFIVMEQGANQGLDVKRTDTNQLLNQLGLIEAMKDKKASANNPKMTKAEPSSQSDKSSAGE